MADSNVSGQAYSLTVMAPIASEEVSDLVNYLDNLGSAGNSPLARVGSTHFARWVVMDAPVFEGGRQRKRDSWRAPRLLFTSNFDGELDPYIERLRIGLGEDADRIWGYCKDYPGTAQPVPFSRWIKRNQIDSSFFYAAYGRMTVEDVERSLARRLQLTEFAASHQGTPPAELQAAFLAEFGS
jgi:hypothetical protein